MLTLLHAQGEAIYTSLLRASPAPAVQLLSDLCSQLNYLKLLQAVKGTTTGKFEGIAAMVMSPTMPWTPSL
jgi:hypothetical protein